MSQSIRISSSFGLTLQHNNNTCIFHKKHTCMDVSFPILSVEECRKRAWITVSNCNPRPPFLLSAIFKDGGTSKKNPPSKITKGVLALSILRLLMDYDDPKDAIGVGHETLLEAIRVWDTRVWSTKTLEFDNNHSLKLTKGVKTIVMLLMDVNDPDDGSYVLFKALRVWSHIIFSVGFNCIEEEKKPSPWISWAVLNMVKHLIDNLNNPTEFEEVRSGLKLLMPEMRRMAKEIKVRRLVKESEVNYVLHFYMCVVSLAALWD